MVKADAKVEEVGAASILAKVSRDELMCAWDKIYQNFGYKSHKGYGTKAHLEAIAKYGQNEISRKSFVIKNFQPSLKLF